MARPVDRVTARPEVVAQQQNVVLLIVPPAQNAQGLRGRGRRRTRIQNMRIRLVVKSRVHFEKTLGEQSRQTSSSG